MLDRHALRWALAIGFTTWVAWCCCVRGPYHFDDVITPLDDPASQGVTSFVDHATVTLRPLTKLTYAIEASLGLTDEPWARRLVSAALQGGTAALLVLIVFGEARRRRDAASPPDTGVTRTEATLAIVVLAYAVHPIHAEAVLELSGRSVVLAQLLLLAAFLAMQRRARYPAAVLFLAACLARETAICGLLPLAILALRDGVRVGLARLAPVAVASMVCVLVFAHNARMVELARYSAVIAEGDSPLAKQWAAIPYGLSLWLRIGALSVDHGEALPSTIGSLACVVGLGVLVATSALPLWSLSRPIRAPWPFALAVVFAAIAPTQSVIAKLDPLTERPFACALAFVPLLIAGATWSRTASRVALGASGAMCAFALWGLATRAPLYASEVALWADAASKSESNSRPYQNWIVSLEEAGRHAEALDALAAARRKFPWDRGLRLTEETYREH